MTKLLTTDFAASAGSDLTQLFILLNW